MREIKKTLTLPIDGKPLTFRLTKLDAFSGAALLRLLSRLPEKPSGKVPLMEIFAEIPDKDFCNLMIVCLQHVEVLLPAGYIPIITQGEWSYPELQHDTATCLKLTLEEVLWTLKGFFGEAGSTSRPETPAS